MKPLNFFLLLVAAAGFGAAFLFYRIAVPVIGPVWLVEWRVFLAAVMLTVVARSLRQPLHLRQHGRRYLVLGFFNTALPFVLFAWAAHHLPASLLSVLNATAALWGVLIARIWGGVPITSRRLLGVLLGFAGVLVLLGLDPAMLQAGSGWAALVALFAACSYAIASQYVSQMAKHGAAPTPLANSEGASWAAALWLVPVLFFVPFTPVPPPAQPQVWLAIAGIALFSTVLASIIYFKLIAENGAASALTVAFLLPVFGILWGHVFLDEVVGWHTLAGTLIVLTGTALVTGFNPLDTFRRKPVVST